MSITIHISPHLYEVKLNRGDILEITVNNLRDDWIEEYDDVESLVFGSESVGLKFKDGRVLPIKRENISLAETTRAKEEGLEIVKPKKSGSRENIEYLKGVNWGKFTEESLNDIINTIQNIEDEYK